MNKRNKVELNKVKKRHAIFSYFDPFVFYFMLNYFMLNYFMLLYYMDFITKPLSNTDVCSDKLQIVKSKKN